MVKSKIASVMFGVSLVVASWLTYSVVSVESVFFDDAVTKGVTTIFPEQTQAFFKFLTFFGSKIGIGVIGIVLILFLWFKRKDFIAIAMAVLAIAGGNEANNFIKDLVERERPELKHLVDVHSYSFPSGHAMVGIILFMLIGYFLIKDLRHAKAKWLVGTICMAMILLIGVSRVVLHVHFPSDILAGYAYGYIWCYIMIAGYEFFTSKSLIK